MNESKSKKELENLALELRRGVVILAVLSQLEEEQYGYSLISLLAEKGFEVDQGTLYPLLRRLEDKGLLESEWRVEGSRVSVDSILYEFRRGSTPEQIQDDFPSLSLARIYAVISYYLNHPKEVDAYLENQERLASESRRNWEQSQGLDDLRLKLRAARDSRAKQHD